MVYLHQKKFLKNRQLHPKGWSLIDDFSVTRNFLGCRKHSKECGFQRLRHQKKSQGALEFLGLTMALIFLFVLLFISVNENLGDKIEKKHNLEIQEIAYTIQDEINLASKSSDGYIREFKVPDKVDEKDYSADIIADMVYVKSSDNKNAIALPVPSISGNIVKGDNIIKKQNGVIYLNP